MLSAVLHSTLGGGQEACQFFICIYIYSQHGMPAELLLTAQSRGIYIYIWYAQALKPDHTLCKDGSMHVYMKWMNVIVTIGYINSKIYATRTHIYIYIYWLYQNVCRRLDGRCTKFAVYRIEHNYMYTWWRTSMYTCFCIECAFSDRHRPCTLQ